MVIYGDIWGDMVRYGEMAHLGEGGAEFGVVDEGANHLLARGDIGEVAWRGAQPPAEGALAKRGPTPATCHQRMCMWVVRRACHVSPREVGEEGMPRGAKGSYGGWALTY